MATEKSLVVILPESVNRAIGLIKARGVVKEESYEPNTGTNQVDSRTGQNYKVVNSR